MSASVLGSEMAVSCVTAVSYYPGTEEIPWSELFSASHGADFDIMPAKILLITINILRKNP